MSHATQSLSALQDASFLERLAALRADLAHRAARRRTCRATPRELDALSDRDLGDLGIHRGQIGTLARQVALRA